MDGLRVRADVGDRFAAAQLPKPLTIPLHEQGRDEEAERLRCSA